MSENAFCAALPIYSSLLKVVGHELFFRDNDENKADFSDADSATCDVLLNAFTSITPGNLSDDDNPVFITLTRNLLENEILPTRFQNRIIYKYSVKSGLPDSVVEKIGRLSKLGFRFAISDIEDEKLDEGLLTNISYLKFNTSESDIVSMSKLVNTFKSAGPILIADKVEDFATFHQCINLGFDAFQGYFLTKPQIIKGHKFDASTQIVFKLIQELRNPDTTAERIEEILIQDNALSYKLFRVLDSAANPLPRKIASIKEAVVVLGLDQLTEWVTLIAFSSLQRKSDALFHIQLVRAAMCERLAISRNNKEPKMYFLAGMFSCLDAQLDLDMEYLMGQIPIDDDIAAAILNHTGPIGDVLKTVISFEQADWDNIRCDILNSTYLESLNWANKILPAFLPTK